MSLTVPELAERVERLRPAVLAAKQREFPRLAAADLEDAYSRAVERILCGDAVFEQEAQLAAYLHRAVSNLARNQIRDAAWHAMSLDEGDRDGQLRDDSVPGPEDRLLAVQARALLREFLAELSEKDRTIAYLRLDPAYECTPRQIARELNVPYQEVRGSLRRTSVNLSRFQALLARPGAFCQRRRPDVLEWQRTGVVPLALRIHLGRCSTCRAQHHAARTAVRHAILPLLPPAALPAVGHGGMLSRLWHAAGAHPLTQRVDDAMSRWRKVAPVGGGGGVAIAAKLATAATVATVGAATAALHAITTHPPAHPHRTAHLAIDHLAVHRIALTSTPSTPAARGGVVRDEGRDDRDPVRRRPVDVGVLSDPGAARRVPAVVRAADRAVRGTGPATHFQQHFGERHPLREQAGDGRAQCRQPLGFVERLELAEIWAIGPRELGDLKRQVRSWTGKPTMRGGIQNERRLGRRCGCPRVTETATDSSMTIVAPNIDRRELTATNALKLQDSHADSCK